MKKILFILTVSVSLICFSSCKKSAATHPFPGKFITETGIQFNLQIRLHHLEFNMMSSSYEGTWRAYNQGDTLKYATIEFAGYFNYYYLRNGKLYRNEHNMIRQVLGEEIEYQD